MTSQRFMNEFESRRLMASNVIFDGVGNFTVNGTSGNDIIRVSIDAKITVSVNDQTESFPLNYASFIYVLAGRGNDKEVFVTDNVFGVYIDGGKGDDLLEGGGRNDTITGGAGNNTLLGNGGDDRLNGSGGHDALSGGDGSDRLYGNAGDDNFDGGAGVDRLFGGDGNDVLIGHSSNDKLYGEAGNDTLLGGKGSDIEDGGSGADHGEQDGTDFLTSVESVSQAPLIPNVVGHYTGTLNGVDPSFPNGPTVPVAFDFTISSQSGSSLQGYMYFAPSLILTGTIDAHGKFSMSRTSGVSLSVSGTINGNSMSGYANFGSILPEQGTFEATKT